MKLSEFFEQVSKLRREGCVYHSDITGAQHERGVPAETTTPSGNWDEKNLFPDALFVFLTRDGELIKIPISDLIRRPVIEDGVFTCTARFSDDEEGMVPLQFEYVAFAEIARTKTVSALVEKDFTEKVGISPQNYMDLRMAGMEVEAENSFDALRKLFFGKE